MADRSSGCPSELFQNNCEDQLRFYQRTENVAIARNGACRSGSHHGLQLLPTPQMTWGAERLLTLEAPAALGVEAVLERHALGLELSVLPALSRIPALRPPALPVFFVCIDRQHLWRSQEDRRQTIAPDLLQVYKQVLIEQFEKLQCICRHRDTHQSALKEGCYARPFFW